ncbi:hypothetical protein MCEMRE196_01444 [Candidatus Nanopelagicaceae bacterium]
MRNKMISLVVATGMITGIGVVGATGAQAESRSTVSNSISSPIVAKPNFVPPTDGGGSVPPSIGERVCTEVQYVSGWVDVLEVVGKVNKWVKVAVYSSTIFCTIVYR